MISYFSPQELLLRHILRVIITVARDYVEEYFDPRASFSRMIRYRIIATKHKYKRGRTGHLKKSEQSGKMAAASAYSKMLLASATALLLLCLTNADADVSSNATN